MSCRFVELIQIHVDEWTEKYAVLHYAEPFVGFKMTSSIIEPAAFILLLLKPSHGRKSKKTNDLVLDRQKFYRFSWK